MNPTAFYALFRKDLKLFFSDKRAVLMSFAAPILIASFFGFLFSGSSKGDAAKVPAAAVDLDGSAVSKKLLAALAADKGLDLKAENLDAARERVRKGKATVAVVVPKGFGEDAARAFFRGGLKPEIGVLYDPSHTAELGMVKGLLTQHAMEVVSAEVFNGETGRVVRRDTLKELETTKDLPAGERVALKDLLGSLDRFQASQSTAKPGGTGGGGGMSMPFAMLESAVTSGDKIEYNGFAHAFAGMGVQFILFMGIEAGISILLLRQTGLWKRLRAAPLSRSTLLGSRAASAAAIALIILAVIFAFARLVFKVQVLGSFAGFAGVCLAFAFMTGAYGLLIAALGRTPEAARGLAIFVTLLMVMLGGAWIPAFVFPGWLQKATLLVPTRWAVDGLDAMTWRGLGFLDALPAILVLLGFAAVFGAVAVWKFRWQED
ncbi:MAG: ABC-2 transporter permease [Holophagaceae bacterium]|nr:ABC-2 transporter permease [Holophagaceae bacterium]